MFYIRTGIILDDDIQEAYACDRCDFAVGYRYVNNKGEIIRDDFKAFMSLYNYCPCCGEPLKY